MTEREPNYPPPPIKRPTTAERFGTGRDWRKRLVPLQHNHGSPIRLQGMPPEMYRALRKAVKKHVRRAASAGLPDHCITVPFPAPEAQP